METNTPEYVLLVLLILYNMKEQERDVELLWEIMHGLLGIELMHGYKKGLLI